MLKDSGRKLASSYAGSDNIREPNAKLLNAEMTSPGTGAR